MGITPDHTPGPSEEEETQYDDRGPAGDNDGDPTVAGALRRVTNTLRFFVGGAVRQVLQAKNPPTGFNDVDLAGVVGGDLLEYNATTKQFEPGAGGGGLTAGSHELLDTLAHEIKETSYDEIEYLDPTERDDIIRYTTWQTSAKLLRVRETLITYGVGDLDDEPTQVVTSQYDGAGVLKESVTEDMTYVEGELDAVTRTFT